MSKKIKNLVHEKVHLIRGERVLLDSDLANFYQVSARTINQARTKNRSLFQEDLTFKLTKEEAAVLAGSPVSIKDIPWAYSESAFFRMSFFLRSDKAQAISKLLVDTFQEMVAILETMESKKPQEKKVKKEQSRAQLQNTLNDAYKSSKQEKAALPKKRPTIDLWPQDKSLKAVVVDTHGDKDLLFRIYELSQTTNHNIVTRMKMDELITVLKTEDREKIKDQVFHLDELMDVLIVSSPAAGHVKEAVDLVKFHYAIKSL